MTRMSRLARLGEDPAGSTCDQSVPLSHDAAGQIASRTGRNDACASSGHDDTDRSYGMNALDQSTGAGATALGYDARGDTSSIGSAACGPTSESRLASAPGGVAVAVAYDPLGRLHWASGTPADVAWLQHDGAEAITEAGGRGAGPAALRVRTGQRRGVGVVRGRGNGQQAVPARRRARLRAEAGGGASGPGVSRGIAGGVCARRLTFGPKPVGTVPANTRAQLMSILLAIASPLLANGAPAVSRLGYPCRSAPLTAAVRTREAAAIAAAANRPMTPRRIDYLLQSGPWKMVWTTPPQERRDVYLFHRAGSSWTLVDRWHGDLGTDDPQAALDWAAARHVPGDLAGCFGTVLVNHP